MNKSWFTVASAITFFRLGLFGVFVWLLFRDQLWEAIIVFAVAWALDAVDGFTARAMGQVSEFGDQLDKWIDRIIIGFGVVFFIRAQYLPPEAILILTKEIGLLPVVTIHGARGEKFESLGKIGKLFTFVQGAAVLWILLGWPYPSAVIGAVALAGGLIAVKHLRTVV